MKFVRSAAKIVHLSSTRLSAGAGEPATTVQGESMLGTSTSGVQGHKSCIFRTALLPLSPLLRSGAGWATEHWVKHMLCHTWALLQMQETGGCIGMSCVEPRRRATSRVSSGLHDGRLLSRNTHYVGRRLTQFPQDSQQSIAVGMIPSRTVVEMRDVWVLFWSFWRRQG